MVGGTVVGVTHRDDGTALLTVEKRISRSTVDQCCVRVDERRIDNGNKVYIEINDSVWWQAGKVMWTPITLSEDPAYHDIQLRKLGHSHGFTHV